MQHFRSFCSPQLCWGVNRLDQLIPSSLSTTSPIDFSSVGLRVPAISTIACSVLLFSMAYCLLPLMVPAFLRLCLLRRRRYRPVSLFSFILRRQIFCRFRIIDQEVRQPLSFDFCDACMVDSCVVPYGSSESSSCDASGFMIKFRPITIAVITSRPFILATSSNV